MELVDIVDRNGFYTGQSIDKSKAHREGILHKVSVVAIIDKEGKVLLQKRAKNKKTEPGKWDLSAAGHVDSGESSEEAAIRETYEEVGIIINKDELKKVDKYVCKFKIGNDLIINHYSELFVVIKEKIILEQIKKQETEVDEARLVDANEFIKMLDNDEVVKGAHYCKKILNYMTISKK